MSIAPLPDLTMTSLPIRRRMLMFPLLVLTTAEAAVTVPSMLPSCAASQQLGPVMLRTVVVTAARHAWRLLFEWNETRPRYPPVMFPPMLSTISDASLTFSMSTDPPIVTTLHWHSALLVKREKSAAADSRLHP